MEIIIIGTNPPCPRCDILGVWVEEIVAERNLNSLVHINHFAFSDPDAIALGERKGLKVGTAKHVAAAAGFELDKDKINEWTAQRMCSIENYTRPADLWNEEFDRMLKKVQDVAERNSYLMTPILVIDGEVKHHGSVPAKDQIVRWIEECL